MPKPSPIEEHKEGDAKIMRVALMDIIEDDGASRKDRTEAVKALARMHHLLQVDRTTVKATAKTEAPFSKDKKKEIEGRVDAILGLSAGSTNPT